MKNNKGFTLIELLAVIIILGVLMLIAIPSISKYIDNSRVATYSTNAKKFMDSVMVEVNNQSEGYIVSASSCINIKISDVELERGSNLKSPFGNYKDEYSYVTVFNVNGTYVYFLTLVDSLGYGWVYQEYNTINNKNLISRVPLDAIIPYDESIGCTASLLYGDINQDGKVDKKDYDDFDLKKINDFTAFQKIIADVNLNGEINSEDKLIITRHINGIEGFETLPIAGLEAIMYGDINLDGKVDLSDPRELSAYLNNQRNLTERQLKAAHLNSDGVINKIDHEILRSRLSGASLGETFPLKSMGYGDVNLDGKIDANDIEAIKGIMDETLDYSSIQEESADLNQDKDVDEDDIDILEKYLSGTPGYDKLPYEES